MSYFTRFLYLSFILVTVACGGMDGDADTGGSGDIPHGGDVVDGSSQPDAPVGDVVGLDTLVDPDVPVDDAHLNDVIPDVTPPNDVPLDTPPDSPTPDLDTADEDIEPAVDWGIAIVDPVQDAEVSGAIRVSLEPVGTDEWLPDSVSLWANGQPIYWDKNSLWR